jgi:hypothetical protein
MPQPLKLHPDGTCAAVTHVDVGVTRARNGRLSLNYLVTGNIAGLRLGAPATRTRADGLWQHTCFEAFVRAAHSSAYYEFNLAPSTQWAAYRFRGYREGMIVAEEVVAPRLDVQTKPETFALQATLDLAALPGLPTEAPWHLGLSAVIEEASGHKSYWALAHPPGKPDFHHADCFHLELEAPTS